MEYDFSSAKKAFSRIGIALTLFFAATLLAQIAFELIVTVLFPGFLENGMSYRGIVILSTVTMYLIGTPVFYLCIRSLDRFDTEKVKCPFQTLITAFVMSISLMYIGEMLGNYVSALIYEWFDIMPMSQTLEIINKISWVDALIFSVLIGPFFEELMFRKLIIDRTRGYGEKLSVIFSAIVFALYHMSVQQLFYTFLVGLLYGYLYIRKGSLLYNWLLHAAFNFFGAVIPLLFKEFVPEYERFLELSTSETSVEELFEIVESNMFAYGIVSWYSVGLMAMAFLGVFWLFKRMKQIRFEKAVFELPKDSEATTAFVNVGVILFITFAIAYPIVSALIV